MTVRVRLPADRKRIFAILVGPVHHDPLYRGDDPVLQERNPHKMPRNVAPLVCPIKKGE